MKIGRIACAALLAACGEVKDVNHLPDAPLPPDGTEGDAAVSPVTVTVLTYTGDGLPDTTAKVVFHGPDNAIVSEGMVDAQGKISAVMPLGGSVTSIRLTTDTATQLTAAITTYTGVKPGDDLVIGRKAIPTIVNAGGQTTMTANFTPIAGAAATYQIHTKCGISSGTASPITLSLRDSCHGTNFDLLLTTIGLTPVRYIRLQNVAHVASQPFTIPAGFSTMADFTITATNTPAEITTMSFARASMFDGAAVGNQLVQFPTDPPTGLVTQVVPYATNVGTRSNIVVTMNRSDSSIQQRHEAMTASIGSSFNLDVATRKLPWLSNVALTATGVTWTELTPGDTPDGAILQWGGRWVDGAKTTTVAWRVVQAAGTPTGMTLPRLPTAYARLDPQAQTVAVDPSLAALLMVDYDNVNGYDELRKQADSLFETSPDDVAVFPATTAWQRRIFVETLR